MTDPITPTTPETPVEPKTPETPIEPGVVAGIDRNDYVDNKLREYGIDPDELSEGEKQIAEKHAEEIKAAKEKEEQEKIAKDLADKEAAEKAAAEAKTKETSKEPETPEQTPEQKEAQRKIEKATGQKKGEGEKYPWEEEGREPTDKEVIEFAAQRSADILEERRAAKEKETQEQQQTQEKQKAEYRAAWEKEWARQIDVLQQGGYLPPIKDKNDKNDPGLIARADLWNKAAELNNMNLIEVQTVHLKGKQRAGATAPISPGYSADTTPKEEDGEFYYDEIHGKDPEEEAKHMYIKG